MENYSFKSVTFGGFDKQDVVQYIEQASEKAAFTQMQLEKENEALRKQTEEQEQELEKLRTQLEEMTGERDWFREKLKVERAARIELEPLRSLEQDIERVSAERDALKPDAESYARFRERLGAIECEARSRADDLEEAAAIQTRRMVAEFQDQYRRLVSSFDAAAGRVNSELRRIEVTLCQLPRSLDQMGEELDALSSKLEKKPGPEALPSKQEKKPELNAPASGPEKKPEAESKS